ncbi:NepR family anti-sigma factor [Prosthecomicrobium sp. N25]|uniref:NepR family anti-sigma factor n=1 Tax=Prosthecomicrobium sp. N25 TaxID=3129254 RepID=UPI00307699B3
MRKEHSRGDAGGAVPLAEEARARLGQRLRTLYGPVTEEPLPEGFEDLLARLADKKDP